MVTDFAVMPDVYMVVGLYVFAYSCNSESGPVNRVVCSELAVVSNFNGTDLWHFYIRHTVFDESETVRPYPCAGVNNTILSDN